MISSSNLPILLTVTVMTSSPQLPTMAILVNNLNEDHDLYTFIRKVREAYETMVSIFLLFKVCNLMPYIKLRK